MAEGFLPVESSELGGVATWLAGPPQFGFLGHVKIDSKTGRKIRMFRCVKCGLLESYAPDK